MLGLTATCVLPAALIASPATAQEKTFDGPNVTLITGIDYVSYYSDGNPVRSSAARSGKTSRTAMSFSVSRARSPERARRTALRVSRRHPSPTPVTGSGVVVGETTLLYGKAGYTNAASHVDCSYTGTLPSSFRGSVTGGGFRVGVGVEKVIGQRKPQGRVSVFGLRARIYPPSGRRRLPLLIVAGSCASSCERAGA